MHDVVVEIEADGLRQPGEDEWVQVEEPVFAGPEDMQRPRFWMHEIFGAYVACKLGKDHDLNYVIEFSNRPWGCLSFMGSEFFMLYWDSCGNFVREYLPELLVPGGVLIDQFMTPHRHIYLAARSFKRLCRLTDGVQWTDSFREDLKPEELLGNKPLPQRLIPLVGK